MNVRVEVSKYWKECFAVLALTLNAPFALSDDAEAGKALADSRCAACHGKKGISTTQTMPNLAGQKQIYFKSAIRAYQQGQRTNSMANVMRPHAANLTDQEIDQLALYYSQL